MKVYPNYMNFSTSSHALLSARPTHPVGCGFGHASSRKLPLTTHPQALPLPPPSVLAHIQLPFPIDASFTKPLAFPFSFAPPFPRAVPHSHPNFIRLLKCVSWLQGFSCLKLPNISKTRLSLGKPRPHWRCSAAPYCHGDCSGWISDSAGGR